jgi:putative PIN family toxin of toxin-antitoxin system
MKVVLDTMFWVSYCTRRNGFRHRLIDRAINARIRLFVSDYILDELADVLSIEGPRALFRKSGTARRATAGEERRVAPEHQGLRSRRPKGRCDPSDGDFVEIELLGDRR